MNKKVLILSILVGTLLCTGLGIFIGINLNLESKGNLVVGNNTKNSLLPVIDTTKTNYTSTGFESTGFILNYCGFSKEQFDLTNNLVASYPDFSLLTSKLDGINQKVLESYLKGKELQYTTAELSSWSYQLINFFSKNENELQGYINASNTNQIVDLFARHLPEKKSSYQTAVILFGIKNGIEKSHIVGVLGNCFSH